MGANALYAVAIGVGLVAGLYLPLNSRFGEIVGSPLLATAVFFGVGAFVAIAAQVALGEPGAASRLAGAPWPYFGLGVLSFAIILSSTIFIPLMGPGPYFVCLVAGQIAAGMALSHFGFFAPAPTPLSWARVAGALLVVAGVAVIRATEPGPTQDPPAAGETAGR
ncbi:MAG: DMT family transporter [Parvularculaceae bacterium]